MAAEVRMFGEVAFEKGFITTAQLYEALAVQAHQEAENLSRKFLGEILVDLQYITEQQVLEILTELHGQSHSVNRNATQS